MVLGGGLADAEAVDGGSLLGLLFFEVFGGVFLGISDKGVAVVKEVVAGSGIAA